jgi:hypothetical protein
MGLTTLTYSISTLPCGGTIPKPLVVDIIKSMGLLIIQAVDAKKCSDFNKTLNAGAML